MLPSFETQRLLIRPRVTADLDACLAMDRDPEVVRFIDGPWADPARHRQFALDRITRSYPPGLGYWSVFAKPSPGAFLGWVLLMPYDAIGPEIEIGWRLIRAAWGRGYAAEAARPVLRHGFDAVGLERVVADIDPRNTRSIRVANKIGLRLAGDENVNGRPVKRYVMDREAVFVVSRDRKDRPAPPVLS